MSVYDFLFLFLQAIPPPLSPFLRYIFFSLFFFLHAIFHNFIFSLLDPWPRYLFLLLFFFFSYPFENSDFPKRRE